MKNLVINSEAKGVQSEAKKAVNVQFKRGDEIEAVSLDSFGAFINPDNFRKKGALRKSFKTKESKEGRLTLVSLATLNAVGEENAVSGKAILRRYQVIALGLGIVVNDANLETRLKRLLNNTKANAKEIEKGDNIPQSNYFNLAYCYSNNPVRKASDGLTWKESTYYLKDVLDVESLVVYGERQYLNEQS